MRLYVVVGILVVGILREIHSLSCYECDSTNHQKCDFDPVNNSMWANICPNVSDVCGMSYTSSIETLEKLSFSRKCMNQEEQLNISAFGPERTIRKKVKDKKSSLLKVVQETFFTCNESLCNSHFKVDSDILECYICSGSPDCDYEGEALVSMGNTFLSRCTSESHLCAASYKMEQGGTLAEAEVSRSCISKNDLLNKKHILGEKLVGFENNSTNMETHLFICNTSGCNLEFPDENIPISCISCNNENDPDCNFDGLKLSDKPELFQPCPNSTTHYCMMWYKMLLKKKTIDTVVRSCVSKSEALRYKRTYGGTSLSGILAKMDYANGASYHMTICGSTGCNAQFPKYKAKDPLCYVCSQEKDAACTLNGLKLNQSHIKTCDHPDDICSLSYRVLVNAYPFGNQLSIVRQCISRENADKFLKHYSNENDFVVFEEESRHGADTYMHFCYFPLCNSKFPNLQESILLGRAPMRCYSCHSSTDRNCTYEMHDNIDSFITVCPSDDDYQCFLSYDVRPTSDKHYNISRSCILTRELMTLKEKYGKNLVALEGESPNMIEHHMYYCQYPLCNLRFQNSNRSGISCYECTLEKNANCDVNGEKLKDFNDSLLIRCPSHDLHACEVKVDTLHDKILSVTRKCTAQIQAQFYMEMYGKTVIFTDLINVNVKIYKSFCLDNACNKAFPNSEALLLGEKKTGHAASGKLGSETGTQENDKEEAESQAPYTCTKSWAVIALGMIIQVLIGGTGIPLKCM